MDRNFIIGAAAALVLGFAPAASAQEFSVGIGVGPAPYYGYGYGSDYGYYGGWSGPVYEPGVAVTIPAYPPTYGYPVYQDDMVGYAPRRSWRSRRYADQPGNQ